MGLEAALLAARQLNEERRAAGFDQAALDAAARQGLGNGAFEDGEEDSGAITEEFFPLQDDSPRPADTAATASPTMAAKLEAQAQRHAIPPSPLERKPTPQRAKRA